MDNRADPSNLSKYYAKCIINLAYYMLFKIERKAFCQMNAVPANQHLLSLFSAFSTHALFHEWAKSMRRISWIRMKMKDPTTPK